MLPEIAFPGFWYFIALILAMIAWRIWGERVMAALRRFEQRRRDADLQLLYDRTNPNSHFRQSVEQLNDDTPAVESTLPNGQAVWNGTAYASRELADAARWRHVLSQARDFYQDLDRSYGNRISGRKSKDTIGNDGE
jgi:arylamine N-acetyltransferase